MPSPGPRDAVRAWRGGGHFSSDDVPGGLPAHAGSADPPHATAAEDTQPQVFLRVARPVRSGISKWVYRHISQDVCPWNQRFATALPAESAYAARGALRGKDARTLARELLAMTQEEFSRAFSKSPMKRAKLRGLKRNAAVVLGNVGTADDIDVLTRAIDDDEPPVREHAAWALARVRGEPPTP